MDDIIFQLQQLKFDGNSTDLKIFIDTIMKKSCKKGVCVDYDVLYQSFEEIDINNNVCLSYISKFLLNINDMGYDVTHICCVVKVLHVLFKKISHGKDLYDDKEFKKSYLSICISCAILPDKIFPIVNEYESEDIKIQKQNLELNPLLTKCCLLFYMDVLFNEDFEIKWMQIPANLSLSKFKKYVLKHTIAKMFILICSRLGNHPWTNGHLKELCVSAIHCFCVLTNTGNVITLLSGQGDQTNVLFTNGLIGDLLFELGNLFKKNIWKRTATLKHSFIYIVTKVKFPHLGEYVSVVVPALLLMIDDYTTSNKLLGISTIQYVIQNVNPADLRLYNHANVIYDVLFSQLFSNKENVYEVTLPTLLKILCVLDVKSDQVTGVSYSIWDRTFEKILQNLDYTTNPSTRRIFLKNLPPYIDSMGGNVIKHVDKIVDIFIICMEYNDGENDIVRSYALDTLSHTVGVSWPVIPRYLKKIFKCLLKFLVDLNGPNAICSIQVKQVLEEKVSMVLRSMKQCCGESLHDLINEVILCEVDEQFQMVQNFLSGILESNV